MSPDNTRHGVPQTSMRSQAREGDRNPSYSCVGLRPMGSPVEDRTEGVLWSLVAAAVVSVIAVGVHSLLFVQ